MLHVPALHERLFIAAKNIFCCGALFHRKAIEILINVLVLQDVRSGLSGRFTVRFLKVRSGWHFGEQGTG